MVQVPHGGVILIMLESAYVFIAAHDSTSMRSSHWEMRSVPAVRDGATVA